MTKQQPLVLNVKKLGINGEGIAYYKKRAVFIPGALPKEKVKVIITQKSRNYWNARLVEVLKKSPHRITPPCPVYDQCGGCQLQHLNYKAQCTYKEDLIRQALKKFQPSGYETYKFLPSIDMKNPWHYRNKLQYQVRQFKNTTTLGLYEENSHQLVPIDNCLVQEEETQAIANTVHQLVQRYRIAPYNERQNSGLLKTLMIRKGIQTGQVQVVFITKENKLPHHTSLIRDLIQQHPSITSVIQNIQPTKTSRIMGEKSITLYGKDTIEEKLNQIQFNLSATAFFQLNPYQTERLYTRVLEALEADKHDIVVDAYCGVGTIGLSLAPNVKKVLGMDTIPSAIEDAKQNAKALGYHNTEYIVGEAETVLPKWMKAKDKPTAIVVDPPRLGLDERLKQALIQYPVQKLVYVSCNPSTLARDLITLTQAYKVEWIQSIDMFPHTARVEAIVRLTKK